MENEEANFHQGDFTSSEPIPVSTPGPLTTGLEFPALEAWTLFFQEARRLAELARQRRSAQMKTDTSTTAQETK